MANQNFVVHNGLTVGGFEVNATTSNVTLPVTKQIAVGNVILRDNGDGKLHVRDITDNSDAEIVATFSAPSTTAGNIQIGTNHIESTNANGIISLRPNGNGNIALSSNTIMFGHGGAYTLIGTGIQTDPLYGVNYPGSNVIMTLSDINSSGNLRLSMTTAATSTTTGALQVSGGIGVSGTVVAAQLNTTGNLLATAGVFNSATVNGNQSVTGYVNVTGNVLAAVYSGGQVAVTGLINTAGNVLATAGTFNALTVNGNHSVTGYVNVTGNVIAATAEVATVEASGMVRANSTVAATSATTGAIVTTGGIGVLKDSVFGGNVTIDGNLFVNGNTSVFNTNNLSINDSLIYLADDNTADTLDIGLISSFTNPGYQHTGFVRDATDGIWKLFANVVAEPTTTVDFTNATYSNLKVGNILAGAATVTSLAVGSGAVTTTGTVTSGQLNTTGNVLATAGVFNALTVNGNLTVTTAYAIPSANAASSLGTSATRWNYVYGVTGNFLSVNANYADLAEKYVADAEYVPGTVLVFGGQQEVTQADQDMSTRVAGVVSTTPAYLMNEGLTGQHVVNLALTGRVPTKVTGTVRKGDLMVSTTDGRARAESNPIVGSVIGKALENSEGDTVIEVVIGKH